LIIQKRTLDFISNAKTIDQLNSCYESLTDSETMESFQLKLNKLKEQLKSKKK